MTDELCPQFGIIGAVCSDQENLCDQYVFCKRARELQKEPDTLPQWAIEAIQGLIDRTRCVLSGGRYADTHEAEQYGQILAYERVLALRKPEVRE